MSNKSLSALEQNCEKILVALAGAAFAGVLVWQLVFAHTTISVGSKTQTIAEGKAELSKQCGALKGKLDSESIGIELPAPKSVGDNAGFEQKLTVNVSPQSTLAPNQPAFGALLAMGEVQGDEWFHEPQFASLAMSGVVVTTDALTPDAIGEEELLSNPELATRFPKGAPLDITWATPWATIDLATMRQELLKNDRTANPARSAIPVTWFASTLFVVDVSFERQQKLADGSWSDPITVPPVPGQDSWRSDILVGDATLRETVFANLKDSSAQIAVLQPDFLATKAAHFISPVAKDATAVGAPELVGVDKERAAAQRTLDNHRRSIERLSAQLEKAGGPLDAKGPAGAGGGGFGGPSGGSGAGGGDSGGGGGLGGGGGGLGGGGGMKGRNNGSAAANDEASINLRLRLTKNLRRAEKALAQDEAAFAKEYPAVDNAAKPKEVAKAIEFSQLDGVVTWTHDLSVDPGSTYRYRSTAKIFNPFFSRKGMLVPAQQELANAFCVSTVTSQWGKETEIPFDVRFFVLRAVGGDGEKASRRATIELYRYIDGDLRRQSDAFGRGDQVGRIDTAKGSTADFSTPWFVVDIFEDLAGPSDKSKSTAARKSVTVIMQRFDSNGVAVRESRLVDSDNSSKERMQFENEFQGGSQRRANAPDAPSGVAGGDSGAPPKGAGGPPGLGP